ncbi:NADH:flavin oxidoreductase/NADH oxidase [Microvirga antarctica]|uniref:NADH:flavin oxidoreductase/NADH oxidase n=1 Tax=Microvirga antarctica TaxID=2819233 RepID=UPI001B311FC3|nr:NADH:flavin oxidoreductase/NADH oxidase [Microvirga antarctica]
MERHPPGPHLFTPLTIRAATFRNRIVLSPMCQYQAVDGHIGRWHLAHHSRFALGGLGAAILEATSVTADGRITPGCTGIYDDAHISGLRSITELYRDHGVLSGIQLSHAGRKGSTARPWEGAAPLEANGEEPAWRTVAPSAVPARPEWPVPLALCEDGIAAIVEAFRTATLRSYEAGFDFVEIHGAHGYLIHSFLSPLANQRNDRFGGSLENRMRFALMVAEAVRSVSSHDRPIFYRASVIDDVEGGVTLEDSIVLATALRERGVDVVDCSAGGIVGPVALGLLKQKPNFQVPLAAAIRAKAGVATMAVGLIIDPVSAENAVANGHADLIALGRELMADSNWVYRAARQLGVSNPEKVFPPEYAFYLGSGPIDLRCSI